MKRCFILRISVMVLLLFILAVGFTFADDSIDIQMPEFEITINGYTVDNERMEYPFIIHNWITYLPMTWDFSRGMGLSTSFDSSTGLTIDQTESAQRLVITYVSSVDNGQKLKASLPTFPVVVNGKALDMSKEEYPLLLYKGITYFPLTWRFAVEEFGWKYQFSDVSGLTVEIENALSPQIKPSVPSSDGGRIPPVDQALAAVNIDGKWGFIDNEGNIVIEPQYDKPQLFGLLLNVYGFSEGLARVSIDEKWGYIDKEGTTVINPQFDNAEDFSEGLASVLIGGWVTGKCGYIDKEGAIVIEPQFDYAKNFSEGLAPVLSGGWEEGKWGYINKEGTTVIDPQFGDAFEFYEGLARVSIEGKWGYVDKKGEMVIKPQFDDADNFSESLARVLIDDKWGFIDKEGNIVIETQFDEPENRYILFSEHGFSEGLAAVMIGDKWGYIDNEGEMVITTQFDDADSFSEGLSRVSIGDKWCFIDKEGNIVIEPQFDDPQIRLILFSEYGFSEGLAAVMVGNKWGYIDKEGNIVVEPQFEHAHPFVKIE